MASKPPVPRKQPRHPGTGLGPGGGLVCGGAWAWDGDGDEGVEGVGVGGVGWWSVAALSEALGVVVARRCVEGGLLSDLSVCVCVCL